MADNRLVPPCPRCTGRGDAHYLTCPVLRLSVKEPPRLRSGAEGYGGPAFSSSI